MNTISRQSINQSVIAVPPLARNDDFSLNEQENRAIVEYLEAGGIKTILYGGNANLYHVRPSEYAKISNALFSIRGTSVYPDATFTLRLAFGVVKGYEEDGETIPAWTTLSATSRLTGARCSALNTTPIPPRATSSNRPHTIGQCSDYISGSRAVHQGRRAQGQGQADRAGWRPVDP